jgi:hypothetical protein
MKSAMLVAQDYIRLNYLGIDTNIAQIETHLSMDFICVPTRKYPTIQFVSLCSVILTSGIRILTPALVMAKGSTILYPEKRITLLAYSKFWLG